MNTQVKKVLLGAALAGFTIAATGCPASQEAEAAGECHGVNTCKGQGECAGQGHDCGGKNECKGKGWSKAIQADCDTKGGTFKPKA